MKFLYPVLALSLFCNLSMGQNKASSAIATARTTYATGDLEDTRFKLQQALEAIDEAIAKEILALLPEQMGNLPIVGEDNYTGNVTGITGLYVNRTYADPNDPSKSVEVTLLNDSPLLAGVNTFLNNPIVGGLTGSKRKRIKVDGYKGSMENETVEGGDPSYAINIPFGNSLLTLNIDGITDENQVLQMINTVPMSQIAQVAQ